MSRIHEALKKAAQERSSRLSSGASADLVDVTTDVSRTTVSAVERVFPLLEEPGPEQRVPFLDFEDLLKKCAHPQWRPDPRINVFIHTNSNQVDAESFRTLRSRLFQTCWDASLEESSSDKQYPGGRQDLCRSESGTVHCQARQLSCAFDRWRSAGFEIA